MTDQTETDAHIDAACKIVIAQLYTKGSATLPSIPDLIMEARRAFMAPLLAAATPEPERNPVVTARASVTYDKVTCMSCGQAGRSLKRHLMKVHGMTPEQYREHWQLKDDHPIVAPGYAAVRSQLAKDSGLGRKVAP